MVLIIGSFNDSASSIDTIFFDVKTSDGRKWNTNCIPFTSNFLCDIEVRYPLDKMDILLPTKTPIVEKYTFKDWEKVFGANPGVSNKIEDVTCLPQERNTFIPSSITVGECLLGSRSFTIKGEWEKKNKTDIINYSSASIVLDNKDGDISNCRYNNQPIGFTCEFKGEGEIKMKEQFFYASVDLYKMKEFDSGKTFTKCIDKDDNEDEDDDEYVKKFLSADSFYINKILIIITLLLF